MSAAKAPGTMYHGDNDIEYSMMQGYAEGFELMSTSEYNLDPGRVADLWMHGSVVRSWLLELAVDALKDDPGLDKLKDFVQDSDEGRGMIADAIENDVRCRRLPRHCSRDSDPGRTGPLRRKCSRLCVTHSANMPYGGNDDHQKRDLYGHTKFAY
jgi:6-phosphogluconate dehydrogenase, C-terminal domain